MSFQARIESLIKVQQAFLRMKELDFLALSAGEVSVEGSGCSITLESEFGFLVGRPLQINCFSTSPYATKWIARTLLSVLANLGIQEVFDTYCGPELECFAICDDMETVVEIRQALLLTEFF